MGWRDLFHSATWKRSLALRMTLVAIVWSVVALAISGVILVGLFRDSAERHLDDRLKTSLDGLAGSLVAAQRGSPLEGDSLAEPEFKLPLSGWYWLVKDGRTGIVLWSSDSLYGDALDVGNTPADGEIHARYLEGPGGVQLRVISQVITAPAGTGYDVTVAGNAAQLNAEVMTFRQSVFVTFAVFAIGLLAAIFFQVRTGLRPLSRMRAALADVRNGESDRLTGDFPIEINPLAQEMNALIEANLKAVERARANAGNLAHALKTPLSVIINESRTEKGPFAQKVLEQAATMRVRINDALEQARLAAERRVLGAVSDVGSSLKGIARVLKRAYADREIDIEIVMPKEMRVRVERSDLDEILGNVLDNACKFGNGRLRVSMEESRSSQTGRDFVIVSVEDNGRGLTEADRKTALQRGRRLDESVPGSGLGLSIVHDLVEIYGGTLDLGESALGGLAVRIGLPSV
ncbi:Sensor protein PhoQ [Hartmannibacter diazotrophicus]|uniref:histidine kinase n=1 Tax=Hartmannibacter diazotrophicus TaxID=1482074 RepID=A0A2C9D3J2_9HYPH|nr:HAMP domain-containing sensor histidine kinase [Hartmannibacter diazotrophicus]SON54897.1 Sensor protein PhoQ [Hartmannibacter diazotrophicus]